MEQDQKHPVKARSFFPIDPLIQARLLLLVCAALAVAAYLQALEYPFVSDDRTYLVENAKLTGLHWSEVWRLFIEPYNSMEFLPLRDFSYWLDIALFGQTPAAFRVHNILLYLLCLALVYGTTSSLWHYFRQEDAAGAPWVAAVATALFAIHPAHVEAVVWISGRKDVLSGMFSMLALWFAVNAGGKRKFSQPYAAASLAALLAAILSKATSVAVAPVITFLWIIFWCDNQATRSRLQWLWPLACLLMAAGTAAIFVANSTVRFPTYVGIEALLRLLAILGGAARLAVSPEGRHYFYPLLEQLWFQVAIMSGIAVVAASLWGFWIIWRQRSLVGFALLVFALLCLPYLQIFPYQTPSLIADRFLFLPVWPITLLIAILARRLRLIYGAILLLVVVLPWSFHTVERPRDWRNFDSVVEADQRAYPGYHLPAVTKVMQELYGEDEYNLAELKKVAGSITSTEVRDVTIKLIDVIDADISTRNSGEATTFLWDMSLILSRTPERAQWDIPLAMTWSRNMEAVAKAWIKLAGRFQDEPMIRYNAGLGLMNLRRYIDSVPHLRAAVESQRLPQSSRGTAFRNLGIALANSGDTAAAEVSLRTALEQTPPDMRAYCVLSAVYQKIGRFDDAGRADANCHRVVNGPAIP